MIKNYSIIDAFKSLDELDDTAIERSVVISGPLNEELEDFEILSPEANVHVTDIKWDKDSDVYDLPDNLYLEIAKEDLESKEALEHAITEKLSDETGWLVESFKYELLQNKQIGKRASLKEEMFELSPDTEMEDIEEFKNTEEKQEPELTVVDTNADEIDDVASNEEAAGSFVFTCDKCGENIFRSLEDLKIDGYERIDDTLFKLKNGDPAKGEFYHCTKCGNDTFTGNKQLVIADVDAEVSGEAEEVTNEVEVIEPESEQAPAEEVKSEENVEYFESLDTSKKEELKEESNYEKIMKYLDSHIDEDLKEGFIKCCDGQCFMSLDGSEWEECSQEEFDELKQGGYKEIECEDDYDEIEITDIEEESLDKAICEHMTSLYENFESYKTETGYIDNDKNQIIVEGKLNFKSGKEQNVRFILEAIESDSGSIKFRFESKDFNNILGTLNTTLTEGKLTASTFDEIKEEELTEASSSFKKAARNGKEDLDDYLDGRSIAAVKDPDERARLVALKRLEKKGKLGDRTPVRQELKRKEDQAYADYEKKIDSAARAGLKEDSSDDEYKDPRKCSSWEEYLENDPGMLSDSYYVVDKHGIIDAENIEDSDLDDWYGDPEGFIGYAITTAVFGAPGNDAECKLAYKWAEEHYPAKVRVLKRYFK